MLEKQASRLFKILSKIKEDKWTSAKELAEECQVSQRTVYRDIEELLNHGIPVEGMPGPEGGYRLRLNGSFPTEALESPIALGQFLSTRDATNVDAATTYSNCEQMVRFSEKEPCLDAELVSCGRILLSEGADSVVRSSFETVRVSLVKNEALKVTYNDHIENEQNRILIKPYGLVCSSGKWHLVGAGIENEIFKISLCDLQNIELTGLIFEFPSKFDLATWWKVEAESERNLER